jgi:hypothetical protein
LGYKRKIEIVPAAIGGKGRFFWYKSHLLEKPEMAIFIDESNKDLKTGKM